MFSKARRFVELTVDVCKNVGQARRFVEGGSKKRRASPTSRSTKVQETSGEARRREEVLRISVGRGPTPRGGLHELKRKTSGIRGSSPNLELGQETSLAAALHGGGGGGCRDVVEPLVVLAKSATGPGRGLRSPGRPGLCSEGVEALEVVGGWCPGSRRCPGSREGCGRGGWPPGRTWQPSCARRRSE
jgi:hypothetical protein